MHHGFFILMELHIRFDILPVAHAHVDLKTYMLFCTLLHFNGTGAQQCHILWVLKSFLDSEIVGMNQNVSGFQMRGDYLCLRV